MEVEELEAEALFLAVISTLDADCFFLSFSLSSAFNSSSRFFLASSMDCLTLFAVEME